MWYCMTSCYKSFIPRISELSNLTIRVRLFKRLSSENHGINITSPYHSEIKVHCLYFGFQSELKFYILITNCFNIIIYYLRMTIIFCALSFIDLWFINDTNLCGINEFIGKILCLVSFYEVGLQYNTFTARRSITIAALLQCQNKE